MKRFLMGLFLIIFLLPLAGCSSDKNPSALDGPSAPIQAKADQDTATANQPIDLNKYLTSNDNIDLSGSLEVGHDRFGIHMALKRVNDKIPGLDHPEYNSSLLITSGNEAARYQGTYYYDRAKTALSVEALLYQSGYLAMVEYDRDGNFNGSFGGFVTGPAVIGMWHDKDNNSPCPFQLWLADAQPPTAAIKPLNLDLIGDYKRSDNDEWYGAYLTISSAVDNGFCFRIEGYWKDHNGMVDGTAFFSDDSRSKAVFVNPGDGLKMDFVFTDGVVEVKANDIINNYAGVNVSLVGSFAKPTE